MPKHDDSRLKCSFCGKSEKQVNRIITGPDGVCICDQCIEICADMVEDEIGYDYDDNELEINLVKPKAGLMPGNWKWMPIPL